MIMNGAKNETQFNETTTYSKIFVGGLAWKTDTDSLQTYFQQFGEILEAAVIVDKRSGRSKGYGFVTFKDSDSAMKACQNPCPVIDGRRANCNIAALGAQQRSPTTPHQQYGNEKLIRPVIRGLLPSPFYSTTASSYNYYQPQYPYPGFLPYGFPSTNPQHNFSMNYYNAYAAQVPYSPGYTIVMSRSPGMYSKLLQYPYMHYQNLKHGSLPFPPSPSTSMTVSDLGEETETRDGGLSKEDQAIREVGEGSSI